jgi:6-phosphofructokinase 2
VISEAKLRCSDVTREAGGGGVNVAKAIRQLGGEATALWSCGGLLGEMMRRLLDELGVPHRPVPVAGETRENLIVYEDASGEQYRFGMPGPEMTAAEESRWLDEVAALNPPPDYLVASGSLPPGAGDDIYARIVERAPRGCRIIVDTSGKALRPVLEKGIFLIKPNLRELGQFVGREIASDEEIQAAARELICAGKVEAVAVSLGSGGAMLVTATTVRHVRSPTVPIKSKVGAGDSMVGGIVLGLAQGDDLETAVVRGVAAGAAAVMSPGVELCRRDDAERLFAAIQRERSL